MKKAAELCGTEDSYISFLEDDNLHQHLLVYLDSLGRYKQAADVCLRLKEPARAIERWRRLGTTAWQKEAVSHLLRNLRSEIHYGVTYREPNRIARGLLQLDLSWIRLDRSTAYEVDVYRMITSVNDSVKLLNLASSLPRLPGDEQNLRFKLLALDAWLALNNPSQGANAKSSWDAFVTYLKRYHPFLRGMQDVIQSQRQLTLRNESLLQLFGCRRSQTFTTGIAGMNHVSSFEVLERSFISKQIATSSYTQNQVSGSTTRQGSTLLDDVEEGLLFKVTAVVKALHKGALGVIASTTKAKVREFSDASDKRAGSLDGTNRPAVPEITQQTANLGGDLVRGIHQLFKEMAGIFHKLGHPMHANPCYQKLVREKHELEITILQVVVPVKGDKDSECICGHQKKLRQLPSLDTSEHTGEVPRYDVAYLAAFIEDFSAQLVLNHYHHSAGGYDGLVIPRSWLLRVSRIGPFDTPNGDTPAGLVLCVQRLLRPLCGYQPQVDGPPKGVLPPLAATPYDEYVVFAQQPFPLPEAQRLAWKDKTDLERELHRADPAALVTVPPESTESGHLFGE
ncbi:hypothetical protein FRB99_000607 [Tulasnella sp. 403]|nr:hypothetical protein FRB99_000607 [Tulasnella sp. 403]